jgi:hypothetical protein
MKRNREDGQPKPRALKPSIRRLIVYRAISQRKIPREFLANELIKEIAEAGEIPPTLETAKKYISKARNSDNPLDKPWTLASCSEYASFFPPESLPILVDYKDYLNKIENEHESNTKKTFGISLADFSIRDAIWIIRLKPLIDHISARLMINNTPIPFLYPVFIAKFYAGAELASETMEEDHFECSDLDKALFAGDIQTLYELAGMKVLATGKPCTRNNNCKSCEYVRIPDSNPKMCIPKRKDGKK